MRSPEGCDYRLQGVHREVVERERFVFTVASGEHPPEWHDLLNENRQKGEGTPES